jgi:hypothetical protein
MSRMLGIVITAVAVTMQAQLLLGADRVINGVPSLREVPPELIPPIFPAGLKTDRWPDNEELICERCRSSYSRRRSDYPFLGFNSHLCPRCLATFLKPFSP